MASLDVELQWYLFSSSLFSGGGLSVIGIDSVHSLRWHETYRSKDRPLQLNLFYS